MTGLPEHWPEGGLGEAEASALFTGLMRAHSADLGAATSLAHMDPPTPKIAQDVTALNAAMNQNLLHPSLSPLATRAEAQLMGWITPAFGMGWGFMCAGSSLGNLNALWAAREAGCRRVVHSAEAHLSVAKAAHILGLESVALPVDDRGRMCTDALPDLSDAALVPTAGTTGRGAVDPLARHGARWLHVDAAWAGPLRFTAHADRLDGIEQADSVAVSAHKWLYQPKDAGMVLFRDGAAKSSIAFGGDYLATPNIGVQGSRSANALPLLATLVAWGRTGLAQRIEADMARADALAEWIDGHPALTLLQPPETGVVVWRARDGLTETLAQRLDGVCSTTRIDGALCLRNVAANPQADLSRITREIERAIDSARPGP